jgi:hypothetical protein
MRGAHYFRPVLPVAGRVATLAATAVPNGTNSPKPPIFLAFLPVYRDNPAAAGSCSGQIATGEAL